MAQPLGTRPHPAASTVIALCRDFAQSLRAIELWIDQPKSEVGVAERQAMQERIASERKTFLTNIAKAINPSTSYPYRWEVMLLREGVTNLGNPLAMGIRQLAERSARTQEKLRKKPELHQAISARVDLFTGNVRQTLTNIEGQLERIKPGARWRDLRNLRADTRKARRMIFSEVDAVKAIDRDYPIQEHSKIRLLIEAITFAESRLRQFDPLVTENVESFEDVLSSIEEQFEREKAEMGVDGGRALLRKRPVNPIIDRRRAAEGVGRRSRPFWPKPQA
jgi:hypothetical protein